MDEAQMIRWGGYGLAWLTFGFFHTMLASERAKTKAKAQFGAHYRLGYNIFATLHLLVIFAIGSWLFWNTGDLVSDRGFRILMQAISTFGFGLLIYAALAYDLGRFSGLSQIRNEKAGQIEPDDEPLRTDGLNAYIRHPIYTGLLLLVWGRAYSEFGLATAVFSTTYLMIGIHYEERKLRKLYGQVYKDYAMTVPMLVPWKGRAWYDED